MFLNNWDVALSVMIPVMIFTLFKTAEAGRIWPILSALFLAAAIIGSLFTGWKVTGSIVLALLLFIPKIVIITIAIGFGALAVIYAGAAAQFFKEGKTKEAARSAGIGAATGMGFLYFKNLIGKLTRDAG
jgi:hypothetical protein